MKIILLYGPGEVAKRQELIKIKSKFSPDATTVLDGSKIQPAEIKNNLQSTSLFSDKRLVILENTPVFLEIPEISKGDDSVTLLLLAANAAATSSLFKSVKKLGGEIMSFEGEKELSAFPYLDSLIEAKSQAFVELDKLLKEYGGVYVLSMIYYLLRRNLLPLPQSSFMSNKIKSQGARLKAQNWQRLYHLTLEAEYKIKSGLTDEILGLTQLTQNFFLEVKGG